jgi:hypothetical protein
MEENGMGRTDNPPYSPDLAPSDFYLFGDGKSKLSGTTFDERRDLLSALEAFLRSIEKSTLDRVFFSNRWRGFSNVLIPMVTMSNKLKETY